MERKASKINLICEYMPSWAHEMYYDVFYHSGKTAFYTDSELPKTVLLFLESATKTERYDPIFNQNETIYK